MAESSTPNLATAPSGGHLSIGEVLALLLEEFPDVTISKIRFLESQGLIDPERTASGYRKFYADDVPQPSSHPSAGRTHREPSPNGAADEPVTGAAALFQRTDGPAEEAGSADEASPDSSVAPTEAAPAPPAPSERLVATSSGPIESAGAVLPGVLLDADELCAMAQITRTELAELESYGVVAGASRGDGGPFNEDDVEIATISKRFLDAGIEPRHLRGWRVAADREAGLLEQLIQPLLRQRNPEARAQAIAQLTELEETGGRLRSAMMRSTLQQHAP